MSAGLPVDLSKYSLPSLEAIQAELARRNAIWKPQPGPQTLAASSKADITGYGGAAGGGKSDLIVGLSLTQHRRSIIFRREHTESRDLFQRAREVLDQAPATDAKVNRGLSTIYLPRGDRQVEFGGVKNVDDWRKHRGRARDGYFFDEATEFPENTIRSLIGWNRTVIPGQRCRVILTFNPPGMKYGQWLISYFGPWLDPKHAKPAEYGELRWYTTIGGIDVECDTGDPICLLGDVSNPRCHAGVDKGRCVKCGGEVIYPLSRTFIKATLDDNAFLRDTNYRASLMALPEPLRSQLLYGDFEAEEADDADQCIPTRWVRMAQDRWREMEENATTPDLRPDAPLSAIGADVARGGKDQTVFCARIGTWFDFPEAWPGVDTATGQDVIAKLVTFTAQYRVVGKVVVGMDVIGVGTSPLDLARLNHMNVVPMHGGAGAPDKAKDRSQLLGFANNRAYWYWMLREALDPEKGENLAVPPDRELLADLCAPKYFVGLRGIQLEDKDEVSKRLGRSPDKGDTFVNAFAVRPVSVGYQSVVKRGHEGGFAPGKGDRLGKRRRGF